MVFVVENKDEEWCVGDGNGNVTIAHNCYMKKARKLIDAVGKERVVKNECVVHWNEQTL